MSYIVGFTATQKGMTRDQRVELTWLLEKLRRAHGDDLEFHHGDCVNGDEQGFKIANGLGIRTVAHPGPYKSKRAFTKSDVVNYPQPYMTRNALIARMCNELIAAPLSDVEQRRSGTWATVRRARDYNRPVTILSRHGGALRERP